MKDNGNNMHLKKNPNPNYNDKTAKGYSNKQKEQIILKLIEKYGISHDEAEIIYLKIEKRLVEDEASSKNNRKNDNIPSQNKPGFNVDNNENKEPTFKRNNPYNVINPQNVLNNEQSNQNNINKSTSEVNISNEISEDYSTQKNDGNINLGEKYDESDFNNSSNSIKSLKKKLKDFSVKFNHEDENSANEENTLDSENAQTDKFSSPEEEMNIKEDESENNVDSIISDIILNYNEQVSIELDHVNLTFENLKEKIDTVKEDFIRTIRRDKGEKEVFHVLKDISFKIYKGEKVGIIGYNGAGKSTLLNVITGIYPPDTGYVKTYGKISPLLSLGAGFDYNYNGRENILLNGAVLGYDKEFLENKIDDIIEFSELGEFIDFPVKNYSNGMIAKLGFSIATIVNPDILIIDEILGVGDVNFRKKSSDKIRSLMDGGTTVLLVSHSIGEIRSLCDKAIWIDNGRVREIGEVNKVCDHYLKDAEKASNEQLANITFN